MGIWERMSRGGSLARASWGIVKRDRSLLVFPALSAVFGISAVVVILGPAAWSTRVFQTGDWDQSNPVTVVSEVVAVYVATVIAVYFNVALTACVARSMRGESHTVVDGINAASSRIGSILGWSAIAVTVGLVLRVIEERVPFAGKIVVWIAEAGWAIAAFFVVPAIVLEDAGPVDALKRSTSVIKARWGEGIAGDVAINVVTTVIMVIVVISGFAGGVVLLTLDYVVLALAVWAVTIVAVLVLTILSSAVNSVFRVVLYEYATTGVIPGGFDERTLARAFTAR